MKNFNAVNAINTSPASAARGKDEQRLVATCPQINYKPEHTLTGHAQKGYTVALLIALGMMIWHDAAKRYETTRKAVPNGTIAGGFGSRSVETHHTKKGNFAKAPGGLILTDAGAAHFGGRETGHTKDQVVGSKEVRAWQLALRGGIGVAGTESANWKFRRISDKLA